MNQIVYGEARDQPLTGVRVVDFTRMLAGPFCTAMLADAGAEVIKVENPKGGDDTRHFAPRVGDESAFFLMINRGKKSIAIDLKSQAGLDIVLDLVRHSDVVIENFKPGVAQKLGIGYESLKKVNASLVYASISGYGQSGPFAHRPAYDIIAQAVGGIMSVNGNKGMEPTRVGESIGDIAAGLYTAWAVSAALYRRSETGRGECIDVAMVDSIFSMLVTGLSEYLYAGRVPEPIGNSHPISAPLDSFRARDGHIIIAVANDRLFGQLCAAMNKAELAIDPRFSTDPERKRNDTLLKEIIESWSTELSVDEAVEILDRAAVPASPILSLDRVANSEHAAWRRLVRNVAHPSLGQIRLVPQPVKFGGSAEAEIGPPPRLGEHTRKVLKECLGLSDSRIARLRDIGALGTFDSSATSEKRAS
ncbi:MAG: CaiB/BaiF CoA transferase family protein [Parvibaculaceae bacterium]